MTIEEAEKACDTLVEKYYKILSSCYAENDIAQEIARHLFTEDATQCAILHQTGIVEMLENLLLTFDLFSDSSSMCHGYKFLVEQGADAKLILHTLKNRVK